MSGASPQQSSSAPPSAQPNSPCPCGAGPPPATCASSRPFAVPRASLRPRACRGARGCWRRLLPSCPWPPDGCWRAPPPGPRAPAVIGRPRPAVAPPPQPPRPRGCGVQHALRQTRRARGTPPAAARPSPPAHVGWTAGARCARALAPAAGPPAGSGGARAGPRAPAPVRAPGPRAPAAAAPPAAVGPCGPACCASAALWTAGRAASAT
mmetsp:Transcript_35194/g.97356  ORF Transcript_35194/g.97356 Transcript_35194/m.97356 type:complete len:209 (-) Transcript_35194:671-1297(-)